jgi:hypothetical protein
MAVIVLGSVLRRRGEDERQKGYTEGDSDIGGGRLARRFLEPVNVKTATAIVPVAYRPDLADQFQASPAALAEVTLDVAQRHRGLHYVLPIAGLDF